MDIVYILLANLLLIAGSVLQGVSGVSMGIIVMPILAMLSYSFVPLPVMLASLSLTIPMAYSKKEYIKKDNVIFISFSMLVGIALALLINIYLYVKYLGALFGVLVLISVGISLYKKTVNINPSVIFLSSISAGFMGALAGVGGQILALLYQNEDVEITKATLAFLYSIFSTTMLVVFYIYGVLHTNDILLGLYLVPGFVIGFLIAPFFTPYFNQKHSRYFILIMASVGAVILIGQDFILCKNS